MIYDKLVNSQIYDKVHPRFKAAFDFLKSVEASIETGRHTIEGDDVYANVSEGVTKVPGGEAIWEAHNEYIDVQYIISGRERMDYAPREALTETKPFDPAIDAALYSGGGSTAIVGEGEFAVFFPHDGHAPGLSAGPEGERVKKVVVKVKL